MKLAALGVLLACGGCSLYFGDSSPDRGDHDDGWRHPGDPNPGGPNKPDRPGHGHGGCGPTEPGPSSCAHQVDVFSVYETSSDHVGPHDGGVTIEQPGVHTLVLVAYEQTSWHVSLLPGATVDAVYLYGYEHQSVDLDVAIFDHSASLHEPACGYSIPYNGGGCDTDVLLAKIADNTGEAIHGFHGCYQAVKWFLHADGAVTSDCNTAAGYQQYDFTNACEAPSDWQPAMFQTFDPAPCTGPRFTKLDEAYQLWVGAIQCGDASHYKLYLSPTPDEPFLQIADYAGHGQDHCELVNPSFSLTNDDEITSGGCTSCSVGPVVDVNGSPVYARSAFGQPFERVTAREWADLTNNSYACGVTIP